MLFKKLYNKPLVNLDRLVITGKYQTSVFYVRTLPYGLGPYCQDLGLICFRNDQAVEVNKKLLISQEAVIS